MTNNTNINYKELIKELRLLEAQNEKTYAKLVEFTPVKNIVYGLVGIVLTTVVGAILTQVLK